MTGLTAHAGCSNTGCCTDQSDEKNFHGEDQGGTGGCDDQSAEHDAALWPGLSN
jgi:hypothetical protein